MDAGREEKATVTMTLPKTALRWKRSRQLMAYKVGLFDKPMTVVWRRHGRVWHTTAIFRDLKAVMGERVEVFIVTLENTVCNAGWKV